MPKQLITALMLASLTTPVFADLPLDRQYELIRLVLQDCGSCHGMRLTGGLGPPLTPDALKDKPADALINSILQGRPGTPMPPWKSMLSEADAAWIVENLQKGFPRAR